MVIKQGMKMKRSYYNSVITALATLMLACSISQAQPVVKEYHKEYAAGLSTTLDITNKYGDVNIDTWDQDKIVIDVKVTVELPSRQRAEKYLSYISVEFAENSDRISAKTIIDKKFSFSGWGSRSRKFSIDYSVRMPSGNNLDLSNRYGNSTIDDVEGRVNLDIKYGNIKVGNLTRGNDKPINNLNLAYGKASVANAGWMEITTRYSGSITLDKCQALLINSKYSKINIGEASSAVIESKYDNFRIGKINNLVLETGYSDVLIETLVRKLKLNAGYGSFAVENIPRGFESLETDTKYTGVKLGINDGASYLLDAKLSYGTLKYDKANFQYRKRIIENNSSEITGTIGNEETPSSKVTINSTYGSVRLYE